MQREEAPLVTGDIALEISIHEGIRAHLVGIVAPAKTGMVLSAGLVCEIGRERLIDPDERAGNLSEGVSVTSGARTIAGLVNSVQVHLPALARFLCSAAWASADDGAPREDGTRVDRFFRRRSHSG